jgi:hypothetical protein
MSETGWAGNGDSGVFAVPEGRAPGEWAGRSACRKLSIGAAAG